MVAETELWVVESRVCAGSVLGKASAVHAVHQARQRFERMWLRLVISKTKIAHLAFLFEEFCPTEDPFPRLTDLQTAMGKLAHNFCETNCSQTGDEFTVRISSSGARGALATHRDGVGWITGRDQREFDDYLPSDGESYFSDEEEDY